MKENGEKYFAGYWNFCMLFLVFCIFPSFAFHFLLFFFSSYRRDAVARRHVNAIFDWLSSRCVCVSKSLSFFCFCLSLMFSEQIESSRRFFAFEMPMSTALKTRFTAFFIFYVSHSTFTDYFSSFFHKVHNELRKKNEIIKNKTFILQFILFLPVCNESFRLFSLFPLSFQSKNDRQREIFIYSFHYSVILFFCFLSKSIRFTLNVSSDKVIVIDTQTHSLSTWIRKTN